MIYIARDGAQQGPFSLEQINAMLAARQIRPADLAWWQGSSTWVPVATAEGVILPDAPAAPSSVPAQAYAPSAPASVTASAYAPPRASLAPSTFASGGGVSPGTLAALRGTRPWVLFIAILGILFTGLMLLAGLAVAATGAFAATRTGSVGIGGPEIGMIAGMGVFYLLLALLYLYPIIKLFKYAGAISRLSRSSNVADLEDALNQQRRFWKFVGILTILIVILYIVLLIFVGVGAFTSFSRMGGGGAPPFPSSFPPPPTPVPPP